MGMLYCILAMLTVSGVIVVLCPLIIELHTIIIRRLMGHRTIYFGKIYPLIFILH